MPFPPLKIEMAHGVLGVPLDEPQPRSREAVEVLSAALRADFGASVQTIPVKDDATSDAPHLVLQSKASHVLFSRVQADFDVRFFGSHRGDPEACRIFVADKMSALLKAWAASGAQPVLAGMIITLHFEYPDDSDARPAQHMLEELFAPGLASDAIRDAKMQLGLQVQDHFYLTLGIGTYQAQEVSRAMVQGTSNVVIRPWEAEVVEEGIELTVDVNNRLRAKSERKHTRVDEAELLRVNNLAWDAVNRIAVPLASEGVLDAAILEQAVA